jgi:hypothetical protein
MDQVVEESQQLSEASLPAWAEVEAFAPGPVSPAAGVEEQIELAVAVEDEPAVEVRVATAVEVEDEPAAGVGVEPVVALGAASACSAVVRDASPVEQDASEAGRGGSRAAQVWSEVGQGGLQAGRAALAVPEAGRGDSQAAPVWFEVGQGGLQAGRVGLAEPAVERDVSEARRVALAVPAVVFEAGQDGYRAGRLGSGAGCRAAQRSDVQRPPQRDGPCSGCRTVDGSETPGADSGAGSSSEACGVDAWLLVPPAAA